MGCFMLSGSEQTHECQGRLLGYPILATGCTHGLGPRSNCNRRRWPSIMRRHARQRSPCVNLAAAVYVQTARAADMGARKHWSQAQAICYMYAHRQASQNLPTCAVQLRLKPDLHPMQCKLLTHLTDTEADNYKIAAAHTIGLCPGLAGPLQRSATVILCFALPTAVPKTQRTK